MLDPMLFDLMNGRGPKNLNSKGKADSPDKKSDSDIDFDEIVKDEVDRLLAMEDSSNQLLPLEARRAKIEQEIRAGANSTESQKSMTLADRIMRNEGLNYLEKTEHDALLGKLDELSQKVHDLDIKEVTEDQLTAALAIPEKEQALILKIAIEKYKQGLFEDSLALLTYLTTVAADDPDYWYRLGLVAQKTGKIPLAVDALNNVTDLSPEFVGAHLYLAECYLSQKMNDEAHSEFNTARSILESSGKEDWHEQLNELESLLTQSRF